MSSSSAREPAVKKKHIRFASTEKNDDDDDSDEQEENTVFEKRRESGRALKSAMKSSMKSAMKSSMKATTGGCGERVEVVGRHGACGRWMVTMVLCASFLGLVNLGSPPQQKTKQNTSLTSLNIGGRGPAPCVQKPRGNQELSLVVGGLVKSSWVTFVH